MILAIIFLANLLFFVAIGAERVIEAANLVDAAAVVAHLYSVVHQTLVQKAAQQL
jgi:hypothetical protein